MVSIFKRKKIRITPQRLAVYTILKQEKKHLTSERIYKLIKKEHPGTSLATVYAILELFKKKGLVEELRIHFDKSCFELKTKEHHHLFCRKCKKIFDISMPVCMALKHRVVNKHLIETFQGYFYGVCKDCRRY